MKKHVRAVDEKRGIVQVTTTDERFYARPTLDEQTGLPTYEYVPSVTWILNYLPKGVGYHRWIASLGWDEAEAVKQQAAQRGSIVHQAIADLLDGKTVEMDAEYLAPDAQLPRELSVEEYEAILSFADWWGSLKAPRVVAKDLVVWGDGWAGTLDLLAEWDGGLTLVDFKSGQFIGTAAEAQVSCYRDGLPLDLLEPRTREDVALGLLQVGYRLNRRRWKFTEVEYQPELFAAARAIWAKETAGQQPSQRDYPLRIKLTAPR